MLRHPRWARVALLGAVLGLLPVCAEAQGSLASAAERARRAWQTHQPAELVGRSPRVTLSLPATAPAEALGPAQAMALFDDLFAQAVELEIVVRAVRSTRADAGYAELRRRFRLVGTQEVAAQTILLAFRQIGDVWLLAEVRVLQ